MSLALFTGLDSQLQVLDMSNTSLTILPAFHLPALTHLNMGDNKLTFVPSSALANMTSLRRLDLSNNYLPSPPHNVWHIMPRLRSLSLARCSSCSWLNLLLPRNPITYVANDSFLSMDRLEELDISHMDIGSIEVCLTSFDFFFSTSSNEPPPARRFLCAALSCQPEDLRG